MVFIAAGILILIEGEEDSARFCGTRSEGKLRRDGKKRLTRLVPEAAESELLQPIATGKFCLVINFRAF